MMEAELRDRGQAAVCHQSLGGEEATLRMPRPPFEENSQARSPRTLRTGDNQHDSPSFGQTRGPSVIRTYSRCGVLQRELGAS